MLSVVRSKRDSFTYLEYILSWNHIIFFIERRTVLAKIAKYFRPSDGTDTSSSSLLADNYCTVIVVLICPRILFGTEGILLLRNVAMEDMLHRGDFVQQSQYSGVILKDLGCC